MKTIIPKLSYIDIVKQLKLTLLVVLLFKLEVQSQTTSIPDKNFEKALIDLGHDSGDIDGLVPTANISKIKILKINDKNIKDLSGIQDFKGLKELYCKYNEISDLKLDKNSKLKLLHCQSNKISVLQIDKNTKLERLNCQNNIISVLNVGNNLKLRYLNCRNNMIPSLDITNNKLLRALNCKGNNMSDLKIGYSTTIIKLNYKENPNLKCVISDGSKYEKYPENIEVDCADIAKLKVKFIGSGSSLDIMILVNPSEIIKRVVVKDIHGNIKFSSNKDKKNHIYNANLKPKVTYLLEVTTNKRRSVSKIKSI